MDTRAPDIVELERMLNDGEGDDRICEQAIDVFERLLREAHRENIRPIRSQRNVDAIIEQGRDFEAVVVEIELRRHEHALDRLREYLKNL